MSTDPNHVRNRLYRSRNGLVLGVCRGIAEYFDLSVFWTRVVAAIVLFCTGLWPTVGIYFLIALFLRPEPLTPFRSRSEQTFYDTYAESRDRAVQQVKQMYDNVRRRIQRLEDYVTSVEYEWASRFRHDDNV